MAWLTDKQIHQLGFACVGSNVRLSDKASYYSCEEIRLGSNIRVDDFCVLSAGLGGIDIGNYIHIAVFSALIGAGNITLSEFCNISSRVSIYSSNDDYSGASMTNPTVPSDFINPQHADVKVGRHVIIGSGSIILPGVSLEEGAAIGALSLVKTNCKTFGIYAGVPAIYIGERRRDVLEMESRFNKIFSSLPPK
jgi:galactoside O-acetyltransferase